MRSPSLATEISIAATRLIRRHVIAGYIMVDQCSSLELERKSLGKATRAVVDPRRTIARPFLAATVVLSRILAGGVTARAVLARTWCPSMGAIYPPG